MRQGQKRSWEAGPGKESPAQTKTQAQVQLFVKFAGHDNEPSDNLYVRGLPSTTTVDNLKEFFTGCGTSVLRAKIIPDTKGYGVCTGMVQVGSQEEAAAAIELLNGQFIDLDASPLESLDTAVDESAVPCGLEAGARRRAAPSERGIRVVGKLEVMFKGRDRIPSDNLYVTGLPASVDKIAFDALFDQCGFPVVWSQVITDKLGSGVCVGMAQLGSVSEATHAIEMLNGKVVGFEPAPAEEAEEEKQPEPAVWHERGWKAADKPSGGVAAGAKRSITEKVLKVMYKGRERIPSDNVYVEGLPVWVDQDSFDAMFVEIGLMVVWSRVIPDKFGIGTSVGMAQLGSADEAELAIQMLNEQAVVFEIPPALVASYGSPAGKGTGEDAPPVSAAAAVAGRAGGAGHMASATLSVKYNGRDRRPSDNLYVSGLPAVMDQNTLSHLFKQCGFTVVRSRLIPDTMGTGLSVGMVQLSSLGESASAIATLDGRTIVF